MQQKAQMNSFCSHNMGFTIKILQNQRVLINFMNNQININEKHSHSCYKFKNNILISCS